MRFALSSMVFCLDFRPFFFVLFVPLPGVFPLFIYFAGGSAFVLHAIITGRGLQFVCGPRRVMYNGDTESLLSLVTQTTEKRCF